MKSRTEGPLNPFTLSGTSPPESKQDSVQEQENCDISRASFFENSDSKLLTVDELARLLSVPRKTIYGWIYRGRIKPLKIGPRLIRFDKDYIARWILTKGES